MNKSEIRNPKSEKNVINILTEDVVGKIAAGEVVERPASVVKELVENAIDAGSTSVEIEIEDAGTSLIRVADNGTGMSTEDALIACRQHSTSKIQDAEDLNHINTLGFRGEALSSISSVSHLDITSYDGTGEAGIYIHTESGQVLKQRPAGRDQGTTIEVNNLFYNVPARRKFLKKDAQELTEILNVVGRFILSYPSLEFTLKQKEKNLLHATKGMTIIERIHLILGGDIAQNLVDVYHEDKGYEVSGFVSSPSSTRKDRRGQNFFINGRFIKSRLLSDAAYEAYRSMLERGRYPSAILFLKTPLDDIDVNVHPTKMQVKFDNDKFIKNMITETIKRKFEQIKEEQKSEYLVNVEKKVEKDTEEPQDTHFFAEPESQNEFSYDFQNQRDAKDASAKPAIFKIPDSETDQVGAIGMYQLGMCYIVEVMPDTIKITDQHAAHERVMYEFFSKGIENNSVECQNLLFPIRLDLSAGEKVLMDKVTEDFKKLGFVIEHFGDNSFLVQGVPAILKERDIKTVIYDTLTDLGAVNLAKTEPVDEMVKIMSCRGAVKAGDPLTGEEMLAILEQVKKCDLPFTCPHGRPTSFEVTVDELEKRFRRK